MGFQEGGGRVDPPNILAVLKRLLIFVLAPIPWGVPGEGPDRQFPQEIRGFGPMPARIRGATFFKIFIVALSAARIWF